MSDSAAVSSVIAAEWCEVLGVPQVTAADEFFLSGGDSTRALDFVGRVERRLGIQFPIEVLFFDGTFGAVVDAVDAVAAGRGPAE